MVMATKYEISYKVVNLDVYVTFLEVLLWVEQLNVNIMDEKGAHWIYFTHCRSLYIDFIIILISL